MTENYTFIDDLIQQLPDIPEDSVLSRTLLDSADVKATLFGFAAGQEMTEHTAAYPALLHVLRGHAEVSLAGDSHQAEAGAWIFMPAKLPHSLRAEEEFIFLLILLR